MSKRNENRPGYKETSIGWAPEEWRIVCLDNIGHFSKGSGITKNDLLENGIPAIRYGEIYTYHNYVIKEFHSFISTKVASSSKKIHKGDILFAGSGETREDIGKCVAYDKNEIAYAGGDIIILSGSKEDSHFLGYCLNHEIANHQKYKFGQGYSIVHIYGDFLKKLIIPLPLLKEQQKIADVLGTWDKAIELVGKQIEAKENFKKGLMQQLLTGKMRLPGFIHSNKKQKTRFGEIPEEWKYVSISKIADQVDDRNDNREKLPVLSCTKNMGLIDSLEYFGKQIFSNNTSLYKVVRRNYFVYATNHIEEGSIGYQDLYDKGLVSPMYTVYKTNDNVDNGFLYKLLKTELYRHIFKIKTNASVNRRGSLRWTGFSKIRIPLPSMDEQMAIATVLDTCEREIITFKKQLYLLKKQKQGLMQKLLTGEVRVKV